MVEAADVVKLSENYEFYNLTTQNVTMIMPSDSSSLEFVRYINSVMIIIIILIIIITNLMKIHR